MECQHFKSYVFGMKFTIITDHSALQALKDKPNLEGRLARWADYLASYDYDIVYRPGKDNVVADFLSRNSLSMLDELVGSCEDEIKLAQQKNKIFIPETD